MKKLLAMITHGLGPRLLMLAAVPLLLMGAVCAVVYFQIQALNGRLEGVLTNTVPSVSTSMEVAASLNAIEARIWHAIATNQDEPAAASHELEGLSIAIDQFTFAIDRYQTYAMPERAGRMRDEVNRDWANLRPGIDKVSALLAAHKGPEARITFQEALEPTIVRLKDRLSAIELNNMDILEANSSDAAHEARLTVALGAALSTLLALLITIWLTAKLVCRFTKITERLLHESHDNRSVSAQLARSAQDLSQVSTNASTSLTQTATAMDQIRGMMVKIEANAQQTSQSSRRSVSNADEGNTALSQMHASIADIRATSNELLKAIDDNKSEFDSILRLFADITARATVINDIVFQTKLLSFNASVEASRAGEHGKGFAVVAEEIGNLARTSGAAAKEISDILQEGAKRVDTIVATSRSKMETVAAKIQSRVTMSESSMSVSLTKLEQIAGQAKEADGLVKEISQAITEQSKGLEEVVRSVQDLKVITEKNRVNSQEIDSASTSGLQRSEELSGIIEDLQAIISGTHAEPHSPEEPSRRAA